MLSAYTDDYFRHLNDTGGFSSVAKLPLKCFSVAMWMRDVITGNALLCLIYSGFDRRAPRSSGELRYCQFGGDYGNDD